MNVTYCLVAQSSKKEEPKDLAGSLVSLLLVCLHKNVKVPLSTELLVVVVVAGLFETQEGIFNLLMPGNPKKEDLCT